MPANASAQIPVTAWIRPSAMLRRRCRSRVGSGRRSGWKSRRWRYRRCRRCRGIRRWRCVARSGVCAGKSPAAHPGVKRQAERRHALNHRRAFHVAQLAPVVVPVGLDSSSPAEEDVGGGLHQPLPFHHPLAGGVVAANSALNTSSSSRTALGRTARSSGSTARCRPNGPTGRSSSPTLTTPPRFPPGWTSTTLDADTSHLAAPANKPTVTNLVTGYT
jgi:hypothetical protein